MNILKDLLKVECSAYDFKEMVEQKKTKSWLKSISAFANSHGGSLFFGINDDGEVVGLPQSQQDAEFISEEIKVHLDPIPQYQLLPHQVEDKIVLEVRVEEGDMTPYYYYLNGTRTAFIRMGNESVLAEQQHLLSLVLKGTNTSYDAQVTSEPRNKYSFINLAATFEEQTHTPFEEKFMVSFGLATSNGYLTNAGLLFADNCPVYQSKLVCTRWRGVEKGEAVIDEEYQGNLLMLLKYGEMFVSANNGGGWVKQDNRRVNLLDYAPRAVFEALVNHLIHRTYVMMGAEVHMDMYDDRIVFSGPGGMYDGSLVQDQDINDISSKRRNPVIADMFTQLDYMEKRGSGLKKICDKTALLPQYVAARKPTFMSKPADFYTILYNMNYGREEDVRELFGEVQENEKTSTKTSLKTSLKTSPKTRLSKDTKDCALVIKLLMDNSHITIDEIMTKTGLSRSGVKWQLKKLQTMNMIRRVGSRRSGHWEFVPHEL